jgi:hypothetical protein
VVGNGEAKALQRVMEASHGGHWPVLEKVTTPSLSLLPGDDTSRPFADQRLRLEDTPSRGKIYKEPLCFYEIEPVVLSVI